jgi:nucleotide-binding universal stress UspA family protein
MEFNGKRILVPVDGSSATDNAFRWACQIAKHSKAELHAIYIEEVPLEFALDTKFTNEDNQGEHVLHNIEAIADHEKYKVKAQLLRARQRGPAIVLDAEERNMEIIILGLPSHSTFTSSRISNVSRYLLDHSHCQVVIWRERVSQKEA